MIKSPLRYPGGKSRAIKELIPHVPHFTEYREPFVGGGSMLIHLKQKCYRKQYWINDINFDLISFWLYVAEHCDQLLSEIEYLKLRFPVGRELYEFLTMPDERVYRTVLDRAARFFVLNRITFSGTVESGGYSERAFKERFTDSSLNRVYCASKIFRLSDFITVGDYAPLLTANGYDVFIFCDPPYWSQTNSKLYGKNGDLHTGFDHDRFRDAVLNSNHKIMITYDDSEYIRELYKDFQIVEYSLQYGMNNGSGTAEKGKELIIKNY